MSRRGATTRVIELSGLSCTGKTTVATELAASADPALRTGSRPRFSAPFRRPAYIGLMLIEAGRWLALYRVLCPTLSAREARRRVRMYIKHLWRRRQQIRSARVQLVIEDEAFATWFARDLARCPALGRWLEENIDLFYPRRVGRHRAEYVLVVLRTGELLRTQRVHRRRLRQGPTYAAAEFARFGTFAERRPAVAAITALVIEHELARVVDTPKCPAALYDGLITY